MNQVSLYLLLDRLEVEGANSVSSPITHGFPAITGFLGAIHALNRRLADTELEFSGVLIACHECHVQRFRPHTYADYSFNQSRNPIKKDGKTASIIEEGKTHLTVSLVVEISAKPRASREISDNADAFTQRCYEALMQQRVAGGSVHKIGGVQLFEYSEVKEIQRALLPAFVLMDARQNLISITETLQQQSPEATELDGLIEVATLHQEPDSPNANIDQWHSRSVKTGKGWLVPISVGFQGLVAPFAAGELAHSRNPEYSSQYVEALYSLGKWVFPQRLPNDFSQCFWRYSQQGNLYLTSQVSA
jgi:CRISPR-associated protein Csy2